MNIFFLYQSESSHELFQQLGCILVDVPLNKQEKKHYLRISCTYTNGEYYALLTRRWRDGLHPQVCPGKCSFIENKDCIIIYAEAVGKTGVE